MCEHKNPLSLSLNEVNKYIYKLLQDILTALEDENPKEAIRLISYLQEIEISTKEAIHASTIAFSKDMLNTIEDCKREE